MWILGLKGLQGEHSLSRTFYGTGQNFIQVQFF